MLFAGWWLQRGLVGLQSAESGAWLPSLKGFAVWCGFLVGYWDGVVRNPCVVQPVNIIKNTIKILLKIVNQQKLSFK